MTKVLRDISEEESKVQRGSLTCPKSLNMLGIQLLLEHKSGPQSRCHSFLRVNGLGWGRMPRVPVHLLISRSTELTRTNSGAGRSPALTWVLPLPQPLSLPGSKPLSSMHPEVLPGTQRWPFASRCPCGSHRIPQAQHWAPRRGSRSLSQHSPGLSPCLHGGSVPTGPILPSVIQPPPLLLWFRALQGSRHGLPGRKVDLPPTLHHTPLPPLPCHLPPRRQGSGNSNRADQ